LELKKKKSSVEDLKHEHDEKLGIKLVQMAYKERGEAACSSLLLLASFLSPASPLGGAPPPC
jgi:hypothetical protein